jgi:hypothetical protein
MSESGQREVKRAIRRINLETAWQNRFAWLVLCVLCAAFFYVFIVATGAVTLPDLLTPSWEKMDGPTTTEIGTVVSVSGGTLKLMRVEYGDVGVSLLAPRSVRVGDRVDVTHSVKHPERVASARLHGE